MGWGAQGRRAVARLPVLSLAHQREICTVLRNAPDARGRLSGRPQAPPEKYKTDKPERTQPEGLAREEREGGGRGKGAGGGRLSPSAMAVVWLSRVHSLSRAAQLPGSGPTLNRAAHLFSNVGTLGRRGFCSRLRRCLVTGDYETRIREHRQHHPPWAAEPGVPRKATQSARGMRLLHVGRCFLTQTSRPNGTILGPEGLPGGEAGSLGWLDQNSWGRMLHRPVRHWSSVSGPPKVAWNWLPGSPKQERIEMATDCRPRPIPQQTRHAAP